MAIELAFHFPSGSLSIQVWPFHWRIGVGKYGADIGPLSVGWYGDGRKGGC